ncbi:MAG: preprotein translocase subunit SecE [Candidatus Colwellbacteria bacterium]|nr:preprotein translocase subunit SecE [Candidatus Colwellbacteria bacterium]
MKPLNSIVKSATAEFQAITWPTKKETIRLALTVMVFSILMAAFLGAADYGFLQLVEKFIIKI